MIMMCTIWSISFSVCTVCITHYRLKWMCFCLCDVLFHSVCMVFLLILLVNILLQVDMSVFVSFVLFQCVVFVLPIASTEWFSLAYCYLVLLLVKCLSQHQFDWKTIQEKQLERVRYTQVWLRVRLNNYMYTIKYYVKCRGAQVVSNITCRRGCCFFGSVVHINPQIYQL